MSEEQLPPPPPPEAPPPPPAAPSPPPPGPSGAASPNRGPMVVLSYLWLFALIPFLVEKNDQEVQWHAKHGLVLTAAEAVLWLVLWIVNVIVGMVFAPAGCVFSLLMFVVFLAFVAFHILCIVKGVKGERQLVPGISEYADRF